MPVKIKGEGVGIIKERFWALMLVWPLWKETGNAGPDCSTVLKKSPSGHWKIPEPRLPIRGTLCLVFSRSNPDPGCPLHPTSVPWVAHAFIYIPYNFYTSPEVPAELSSLSSCVSDHLFSVFQVLASFMSPLAPAYSALPEMMAGAWSGAGRGQGAARGWEGWSHTASLDSPHHVSKGRTERAWGLRPRAWASSHSGEEWAAEKR